MKLLVLLLTLNLSAQQFAVKEVKYENTEKGIEFVYPVIETRNAKVGRAINDTIRERVLYLSPEERSLEKKFKEHAENGTTRIEYEVTSQKHDILSIKVYVEGCGAYCEGHYEYFNFDLTNGKSLTLFDLVDPSKIVEFEKIIKSEIKDALEAYREDLRTSEEDPETIAFAAQEMQYCIDNVGISHFSLTPDAIELLSPCPFPHAIRAIGPGELYVYSYEFIKPYLRKEYQSRIGR